jgi:hypothetical protein
MADAKPQPKPAKSSVSIGGMILGIIFAVVAIAMLPTTLIILVGMVPTAVAYFVDSSREKTLGPTVLTLNAAGILPALLKLWHDGHSVDNSLQILMTPSMLLFFLLPSAMGWALFNYVPYLVIGIIRRKAQNRITDLKKYQEDLIEKWGPGVGHYVPKSHIPSDTIETADSDKPPSALTA